MWPAYDDVANPAEEHRLYSSLYQDDVRYASSMLDASESWYPAITADSWVQLDLVGRGHDRRPRIIN